MPVKDKQKKRVVLGRSNARVRLCVREMVAATVNATCVI